MSGQTVLIVLLVGGIAGWLAGLVMRGAGYGIIGDVIVGVLGAVIGTYLVGAFHLPIHTGNPILDLGIVAFIGAIVLLLIIGLVRPRTFGEHVRGWWGR